MSNACRSSHLFVVVVVVAVLPCIPNLKSFPFVADKPKCVRHRPGWPKPESVRYGDGVLSRRDREVSQGI